MTERRDERVVAGLSCSDVLALLSDYLDDELGREARRQVEDHLRGCEGCTRFGGQFRATVKALRFHLGREGGVPERVLERLQAALERER